jgi:hypothetical protein
MHTKSLLALFVGLAIQFLCVAPAHATLKFYYDPLTGNVSFDTSETRSGSLVGYALSLTSINPPFQFRPENMVRLSTSTYFDQKPDTISEFTFTAPLQGLFTVGDILPAGLSQQTWSNLFARSTSLRDLTKSVYNYTDVVGGGSPPNAEFLYGRPTGEFENKWDLVDPATLTWATTAKLVYKAWSGEVVLDTTGATSGFITNLLLQSNGQFLPGGFTPFVSGPFNSATTNLISLFADAIEPGQYSLGRILPAGLTAGEYEERFTSAKFMGRAGFSGNSFDFATYGVGMQLQFFAVPEPASAGLIICGAVASLIVARQKRARTRSINLLHDPLVIRLC